jgi:hypothetical protein
MKARLTAVAYCLPLFALLWAAPASAFYDPQLQRWVNRDPIREEGGANLYASMFNSPLRYIDHNGRFAFAIPLLFCGAGGGAAAGTGVVGSGAVLCGAGIVSAGATACIIASSSPSMPYVPPIGPIYVYTPNQVNAPAVSLTFTCVRPIAVCMSAVNKPAVVKCRLKNKGVTGYANGDSLCEYDCGGKITLRLISGGGGECPDEAESDKLPGYEY